MESVLSKIKRAKKKKNVTGIQCLKQKIQAIRNSESVRILLMLTSVIVTNTSPFSHSLNPLASFMRIFRVLH